MGAIQGATEFLPVSSSGHLAAGQLILIQGNLKDTLQNQPLLLEILLHVATLLAVVLVYRRDILGILQGMKAALVGTIDRNLNATLNSDKNSLWATALFVGTIPTGILGFLLKNTASAVASSPLLLGISFLCCAAILFASRFWKGGDRSISLKTALIIGLVQGIAVLPGISRSGITIVTALALGLDREDAAKFSFLLSIPAILGAAVLEIDMDALFMNQNLLPLLAGAAAAFAVGIGALVGLIKLVKAGRLWLFSPYVALVGISAIAFF